MKAQKIQVHGNRQGGGDQRRKHNRPKGEIPPAGSAEKLRRLAEEIRATAGAPASATLTAVAMEPVE